MIWLLPASGLLLTGMKGDSTASHFPTSMPRPMLWPPSGMFFPISFINPNRSTLTFSASSQAWPHRGDVCYTDLVKQSFFFFWQRPSPMGLGWGWCLPSIRVVHSCGPGKGEDGKSKGGHFVGESTPFQEPSWKSPVSIPWLIICLHLMWPYLAREPER